MSVTTETKARAMLVALVGGLLLILFTARWFDQRGVVEVHAAMPEQGGWSIDSLSVQSGAPLRLRLISDDVYHGFAIGQHSEMGSLDLPPGQPVETTLVFAQPGKYVFYCTRWCGPNHWRMRGTIEVSGPAERRQIQPPPLYVDLGLDIDAEHYAEIVPERMPSAARGAGLEVNLPSAYRTQQYYQTHSPVEAWRALRQEPSLAGLDDQRVWDLVAFLWAAQTTPEKMEEGRRLYAANCAACHGEAGQGEGVMAGDLAVEPPNSQPHAQSDTHSDGAGHGDMAPTDFTEAEHMLGASPAVLHGKIVRGGMGTGMPYWGPIFTEEQVWKLVSYLWTFQFNQEIDN